MAVTWRFELAQSADMSVIRPLILPFGVQISWTLNAPGSLSFSLPIEADEAYDVECLRTCVKAYRNNQLVWSGPVWTIEESAPEGKMNVGCVGWFELLNKRFLSPTNASSASYSATDAGQIAYNLLGFANSAAATLITEGFKHTSVNRTVAYAAFDNIGQKIKELSDVENGYDFEVTYDTRQLNIYYPRKGSERTETVFKLGGIMPSLARATRQIDASRMANYIYILGADNNTGFTKDDNSISVWGRLEDVVSYTSVKEDTILGALVNAELAVRKEPIITYQINPLNSGEFELFYDYNVGDTIYFTVDQGRFQAYRQAARVYGISVSVTEEDNEVVNNLQISPVGA